MMRNDTERYEIVQSVTKLNKNYYYVDINIL